MYLGIFLLFDFGHFQNVDKHKQNTYNRYFFHLFHSKMVRVAKRGPVKKIPPEVMEAAVEAVKEGKMNLRKAAKEFGIPKSTLLDKIKGKHRGSNGRPTELTPTEEKLIVERIKA